MSRKRVLDFEHESHFPKTISQQEFDYDLFTKLPRTTVDRVFLPISFKLEISILPLMTTLSSLQAAT